MRAALSESGGRTEFWQQFIGRFEPRTALEVGVWKGEFAKSMLGATASIRTYILLDPWRHLASWQKPRNVSDAEFADVKSLALDNTSEYEGKRVVLAGTTTEVIGRVRNGAIDFAYIDGDHSLRGITVDLVSVWPKVSKNGVLAGDDFNEQILFQRQLYEPTLVFPFAIYFAESVGRAIYLLPHNQFLIDKGSSTFRVVNLTDRYQDHTLLENLRVHEGSRGDEPVPPGFELVQQPPTWLSRRKRRQ